MDGQVYVVRGRKVLALDGNELRRAAHASQRVVIDLGTGDGRWVYRLARGHPDWCCIGVDANAAAMRKFSWRASRKMARGGAPNAWFVLAAVETLPGALLSIADEVHVQYPWGSLRQMLLASGKDGLGHLARIAKPGAAFQITLNLLSEDSEGPAHLPRAYARAGLDVRKMELMTVAPATSWGKRIGQGGPMRVLVIGGKVGLKGS
jgi:16S rRNA (adenine(1408)-N(1))-methyltransferase